MCSAEACTSVKVVWVLLQRAWKAECNLDAGTDERKWGPHLVRRIGRECANAAEGAVDPCEHQVQRGRKVAHLIASVSDR